MSQQGGRPTGHEDDWWRELYEDSTDDTGPTPARDSLDDRFASASGAVGDGAEGRTGPSDRPVGRLFGAEPMFPAPRSGADDVLDTPRPYGRSPQRAPWEPPLGPTGPVSFPTAAKPPGRAERKPDRAPTDERPREAASPVGPGASAGERAGLDAASPADPRARPGERAGDDAVPPVSPGASAGERAGGDAASPVGPGPSPGERGGDGAPPAAAPRPPSESPRQPPAPTTPTSPTPPVPSPPTAPPTWPPLPAEPPSAVPRPADPQSVLLRPADPAPPPPTTDPPPGQPGPRIERPASTPRSRGYVGTRPPTYDGEPTALPAADPDDLDDLVADTVLDGARYGACTVRAVSVRGDSARYRGEPRRDSLLTARFGTGEHALLLVAMATGARATPGAHRAAAEACHWIGRAVGRSHARLVEDIRDGRRGDLKSGLHRLTDRSLGKLRASASEQGVDPEEYAASLRCLLLSADPACRTRVFFGVGPGGLFRLREGEWQDIEPQVADVKGEPVVGFGSPPSETPEGDRLTMDLGIPTPPSPYEPAPEPPREPFRFRTSVARPGDTLLMCSGGLAEPLRAEPELGEYLAERWSRPEPPGLAAFLADSQVRVKGYADDRTAAAVWEA
ncbi:protein phosphatase 2C domain-containing protein [Streptomyces hawaiiensis]